MNWENHSVVDIEAYLRQMLDNSGWDMRPEPVIYCTQEQLPYYRKIFGIPEPGELSAKDEALIKRIYEEK